MVSGHVISSEVESRSKAEQGTRDGLRVLEDDQLDSAKAIWLEKMAELARREPDKLLRSPKLVFLLYRWREWDQTGGPGTWLRQVLNSSQGTRFLTSIAQRSRSFRSGDHVSEQHTSIRLATLRILYHLTS